MQEQNEIPCLNTRKLLLPTYEENMGDVNNYRKLLELPPKIKRK